MIINTHTKKRILRLAKKICTDKNYVINQIRPKILYNFIKIFPHNFSGKAPYNLNTISFFLSWRCNLKCVMCNLWGETGSAKINEELTINHWLKIIDDIAFTNANIVFTGGEPLLYKNWEKIAQKCKEKKLTTQMLTNGLLLAKYKHYIVNYIDTLNISLDGLPETNDEIRKNKGLFAKIINNIKTIHQLKQKNKSLTPYINIAFTISDKNYLQMKEFIKILQPEHKIINNIIFQHLEFTSQKAIKETEDIFKKKFKQNIYIWKGFYYNPKNLNPKKLVKIINEIKMLPSKIPVVFFPDFKSKEILNYYSYPEKFPFKKIFHCWGPFLEALITPEGNLWICPDYVVGNLTRNNFKQLWNNEKSKFFRRFLVKKNGTLPVCRCCGCFYVR